jgi:1-aminocyclopropane-1-carboxylate deaminase
VKREDLIHPLISGNKWRKLKYNLMEAEKQGFKTILSFGGAFSNHIYSLAAAGKIFGFDTIGIIRGEKYEKLNPTLSFAESCGMKIFYLGRESYRGKEEREVLEKFKKDLPPFYLVPEGGSNAAGVKGCEEIIPEINEKFNYICTACGTGGTVSGLIRSAGEGRKVLGFSALKGEGMLDEKVKGFVGEKASKADWKIFYEYHFGGYAKINPELISFMKGFERRYGFLLEPVYTAKMFFGIFDLIHKGYFPSGSKIIALHTGGLQGREGMREILNDEF